MKTETLNEMRCIFENMLKNEHLNSEVEAIEQIEKNLQPVYLELKMKHKTEIVETKIINSIMNNGSTEGGYSYMFEKRTVT